VVVGEKKKEAIPSKERQKFGVPFLIRINNNKRIRIKRGRKLKGGFVFSAARKGSVGCGETKYKGVLVLARKARDWEKNREVIILVNEIKEIVLMLPHGSLGEGITYLIAVEKFNPLLRKEGGKGLERFISNFPQGDNDSKVGATASKKGEVRERGRSGGVAVIVLQKLSRRTRKCPSNEGEGD